VLRGARDQQARRRSTPPRSTSFAFHVAASCHVRRRPCSRHRWMTYRASGRQLPVDARRLFAGGVVLQKNRIPPMTRWPPMHRHNGPVVRVAISKSTAPRAQDVAARVRLAPFDLLGRQCSGWLARLSCRVARRGSRRGHGHGRHRDSATAGPRSLARPKSSSLPLTCQHDVGRFESRRWTFPARCAFCRAHGDVDADRQHLLGGQLTLGREPTDRHSSLG